MTAGFAPLPVPTTPDEAVLSFRTHSGYVRAIRAIALGDNLQSLEKRLETLAIRAKAALPIPTVTGAISDDLRGCLHRAWATELILGMTYRYIDDPDVLRLASAWGAVQSYYALYAATQALHVAGGRPRPTAHNPTQKLFIDQWCTGSLQLPPWTVSHCDPAAVGFDGLGFRGADGNAVIPGAAHQWTYTWQGDDALHVLGSALRSTRAQKVDEALDLARRNKARDAKKEWQREEDERLARGVRPRKPPDWPEKRNLTRAESTRVRETVRPVSLMDYLYRLRIKSNYLDAQMYSDGPESDSDASTFLRDLVEITAANLLVHELRLARMLGVGVLESEMDAWLTKNRRGGPDGSLSVRRTLVAAHA